MAPAATASFGVKVRASNTAAGLLGAMSTRLGKQAAAEAGRPLMVHIGNAPPTLDEVCAELMAGDIITHCFHGKVGGVITAQGALRPSVAAALDRGVLLDIGHGSASFAWAVSSLSPSAVAVFAGRAASKPAEMHRAYQRLREGCMVDVSSRTGTWGRLTPNS